MKYEHPWPHLILDDFLDQEDLDLIVQECNNILELVDYPDIRHQFLIDWNVESKKSQSKLRLNESNISFQYDNALSYIPKKYESKLKKIYKQLNNKPSKHKFVNMELMICNKKFEHSIHDENPSKILSAVTYISKDNNNGTTIYNSKNDEYDRPVKKIKWKQNRCFIFSGQKNKTWHAFSSNGKNVRITLNLFLCGKESISHD